MAQTDPATTEQRLAEAVTALEALRRQEVDAIVGERQVILVRLHEAEKALRDTEKLLDLALRPMPLSLWQQDEELCYSWVYNAQLGYAESDMIGRRDVDLFESRDEAERLEALKRAVLETGVGSRQEVQLSRDGVPHYYDLIIEPLYGDDGKVKGINCAALDITSGREARAERERMLAELAEWNETLEQQIDERTGQVRALSRALARAEQEERRRIAQVLHDDVQQLLTALHIQMSLLERMAGPDVRAVLVELGDLTRQTIRATRSLSAELSAPALQSADLDDMLAALAAVMAEHYRLQVRVEMKGHCTIANRSSREQIWLASRELLFNVVKHAGVDEARVVARPDGDSVIISIEDDGAGFDVDAASRSAKIGKSMGLLTVSERLELFGGRLEIESTPGVGTRATITMPLGEG